MYRLISFLVFLLVAQGTYAQFTLIKIGLNDCVKCKRFLDDELIGKSIKTPTYIVFHADYDSLERVSIVNRLGKLAGSIICYKY